jgi:hypothetical protein
LATGVAAGNRPANGRPPGINEARPLGIDAACGSRLAGPVAGVAGVLSGAAAPGSAAGGCGRVTDAVAVCGGVAGVAAAGVAAVFRSEVKPCMSCDAAAGLDASCWKSGRPGRPGASAGAGAGAGAGAAGWAAAVPLNASAAVTAPAAAIIVVANSFLVLCMVLPIRLLARLRPNVRSYWCYSSDTCGGYGTVTDSKGLCDRSIESGR